MAISRVTLDGGIVTYVAHGKGDALTQYRLENLDVTVTGGATQLGFKGDAKVQPGGLALKISDGTVGLQPGRPLTDAALRGKVAVEGKDIKDLAAAAAGPSPEYGGSLKGTLTLGGTVGAPTAAGEVQMSPLTVTQAQPNCPEPKRRTLTIPSLKLNTSYQEQRLGARPLTAALGDGTHVAEANAILADVWSRQRAAGLGALGAGAAIALLGAGAAIRKKGTSFGAQYHRLVRRLGKRKALVAVAHALLVVIYCVLRDRVP